MPYQVLSLKWRPQTFTDLVGQKHVSQTLINAFKKDRVAQAYALTGPRGVGKTTTARIIAKALNCKSLQNFDPCNGCSNCKEISDGRNIDVIEIDGASNRGIEEIRTLREQIKYPPMSSSYKVYIIDEVHMLTTQAFNALLRTLEEPPSHGKFILATTDAHKIPSTIISPPLSPPSGPKSIIQSEHLITSRLCSITITELPLSTKRCITSINL